MYPNLAMKFLAGLACAILAVAFPNASQATKFKLLYSFTGISDGGNPAYGNIVIDKSGNLYGTTTLINQYNAGTVFKLSPDGIETVLFSFGEGSGGNGPEALFMDKKGNLWGTACCGGIKGGGVIFEINKAGKERVVRTFAGQPNDGAQPFGALLDGIDDQFCGTTNGGGKYNVGTVFKLAEDGSDTVLYSFNEKRGGFDPFAGLISDTTGNLFGTATGGGEKNFGTVFELARDGTETVLHSFKGSPNDGSTPDGALIEDQSGDLYGTTFTGGRAGCYSDEGCGTVFRVAPDGTETLIHFFTGEHEDGANPIAGLVLGRSGNLLGTTYYGGNRGCGLGCGTVFSIAPHGAETILHKFHSATDGANPLAGLVADGKGNLYGTTNQGGAYGYGTIFEIIP